MRIEVGWRSPTRLSCPATEPVYHARRRGRIVTTATDGTVLGQAMSE
jgi:hypothetical protein